MNTPEKHSRQTRHGPSNSSMDSPFIQFANNLSPINALKLEQNSFSTRCARRSLHPTFLTTMNLHGANSLSRVPLSDVTNLEVSWDTDLINSLNCTTPIKENPRVGGLLDESTSILTQKPSVFTPPPFFNSSNEYRMLDHNSAHTTGTDGTLKVYPALHAHSATTGAFGTPVLDVSDQIPCGDKEAQKQLSVLDDTKLRRSKAKRKMSENGCRGCNCKKSECLKLYCECFAAGVYCTESCTCNGCSNTSIHEATVVGKRKEIELRSPLAFAPKVIRPPEQISGGTGGDATKTPAARHKHGCNCRRSDCLKDYCDCFKAGVGCSLNCRCEGCRNKYGRRDEPDGLREIKCPQTAGNSCLTDGEGQDSWPNVRALEQPYEICSQSNKFSGPTGMWPESTEVTNNSSAGLKVFETSLEFRSDFEQLHGGDETFGLVKECSSSINSI